MARSTDIELHVPNDVLAEIRQSYDPEERREIEGRRYSLNRTWEAQVILEYALREFARQQGHDVTEDTEIVPLPSGDIEIDQSGENTVSINPM